MSDTTVSLKFSVVLSISPKDDDTLMSPLIATKASAEALGNVKFSNVGAGGGVELSIIIVFALGGVVLKSYSNIPSVLSPVTK